MSATPEFTEAQLTTARKKAWHQSNDPLLTLEEAKAWVAECGLVLFAPQPRAVATSAPSLVEATLGDANAAPTAAQADTARSFVARLTADGAAIPLNLLGGPGDVPDFIVSVQAFPYVFTLRGDKTWKQPPSTSSAAKVSPLALKVYETLTERGAMTAGELASDLGRELTEPAVLRALGELWAQMRAIPLLQQGEGATLWELTTRRFTKAIKAGANAGQPTALSALVSLFLNRVYAATEDEIATFLSPLTARSRVRDVLHGLSAGRQLENVVVEGKTQLYIPGALPAFEPEEAQAEADSAGEADAGTGSSEAAVDRPKTDGRIRRFDAQRSAPAKREYKPRERDSRGSGPREQGERPRRSFDPKRGEQRGEQRGERGGAPGPNRGREQRGGGAFKGRDERERRPFRRDSQPGEKPAFNKPWDEERRSRPARPATGAGGWKSPARRNDGERRGPAEGDRGGSQNREFRGREGRPERGGFGERSRPEGRPQRPRREGENAGPGRRERSGGFEARPPRSGPRPGPRPGGDGQRGPDRRGPRPATGDRRGPDRGGPARRGPGAGAEGGARFSRPAPEGGFRRPARPRPEGGGGDRGASRGEFRPRPAGDRPRGPGGFKGAKRTGGGGRPPFAGRKGADQRGGYRPKPGGAPRTDRPSRPRPEPEE